MARRKKKVDKDRRNETLIEMLHKYRGNISAVARAFGRARSTIYDWVEECPEAQEALSDARETTVDDVTEALVSRAISHSDTAAIFILKTLGKERGFVERQEVAGVEDKPLQIEYVNDWRDV